MSFVLAYLALNAPPTSIRRLTCVYILAFASAAELFTLVGAKHVVDLALMIGAAFTFTAWVSPPLRFLRSVARSGTLAFRIFDSVSVSVQFTYGFALTMVVVLAAEMPHNPRHALGVVALIPRLVALAAAVGMSTPILIHAMRSRPTVFGGELRTEANRP